MTKKEQILSSFLKTKLNIPKGVKYEFVDLDGKRALKFYTDVAKTDKNSGQYDEEYAKFFKPKNKTNKIAMFVYDWSKKFQGVLDDFFKQFDKGCVACSDGRNSERGDGRDHAVDAVE